MTKEEAIEHLNTLYMALAVFPNQQISLGNVDEMKRSVNMAIKALKQENVLDEMFENIKTEIDFIPTYGAKFADGSINVHVNKKDVLQIIDKYRGE